ncbi:translation initiation factor IF-2-like [Vulpes lagopus]|uniref:translation initiation factor IF-2-like n=1 Tax=Vulpes lagopus TaxID=494514 RepID=UPI001BCA4176|nr:translation initiation factor IF-2-like [Vulpes lagopus]
MGKPRQAPPPAAKDSGLGAHLRPQPLPAHPAPAQGPGWRTGRERGAGGRAVGGWGPLRRGARTRALASTCRARPGLGIAPAPAPAPAPAAASRPAGPSAGRSPRLPAAPPPARGEHSGAGRPLERLRAPGRRAGVSAPRLPPSRPPPAPSAGAGPGPGRAGAPGPAAAALNFGAQLAGEQPVRTRRSLRNNEKTEARMVKVTGRSCKGEGAAWVSTPRLPNVAA